MNFVNNKINVGKGKSFNDLVKDYMDKKEVKTASSQKPVTKTAEVDKKTVTKTAEADEAQSSGQLDVEPLHQKGESTNQDSVAGGKHNEGGDTKSAPKKATSETDSEGKDSGQPKAEGSEKFTNDPEVKDEQKKKASKVGFKKIANLTESEKARLSKYWRSIYPQSFVDALLADK